MRRQQWRRPPSPTLHRHAAATAIALVVLLGAALRLAEGVRRLPMGRHPQHEGGRELSEAAAAAMERGFERLLQRGLAADPK